MDDSTTIFIDFHKKHPKTLCFSVVSRPAEAQVPIFTAQMKKASKKCQKSIVFFDFSNHAGAQVPIFTPKMKNFRFARLARPARLSTRKWDFRRRSRPRELAQRSQDDVSLNKLPQIIYPVASLPKNPQTWQPQTSTTKKKHLPRHALHEQYMTTHVEHMFL